jgi:hypothetical protein
MATFRIGDRVRVVAAHPPLPQDAAQLIGKEGEVMQHPYPSCTRWPVAVRIGGTMALFTPGELAPLTDPKADAFVESIKKLKPYEEPKVEPVKERA